MPRQISEFFLFGDSHATAIAEAAKASNLPFKGGMLMSGRYMESQFYTLSDGRLIFPEEQFGSFLNSGHSDVLAYNGPILSTIGSNSWRFAKHFVEWEQSARTSAFASEALFNRCVLDHWTGSLSMYSDFEKYGHSVYIILSPIRYSPKSRYHAVSRKYHALVEEQMRALGHKVLNIDNELYDKNGAIHSCFENHNNNDQAHGNVRWGNLVLGAFLKALNDDSGAVREIA